LHTSALVHRSSRSITIDQQLHLGGSSARRDDAPDHSGGRNDRHVALQPVARAFIDRDRLKVRARANADDVRCGRRQRNLVAQLQQPLQLPAAFGECVLLLQLDFQRVDLMFQRFIFGVDAAQIDIASPRASHAVERRGGCPLDRGEDTERHCFQHRDARSRVHLRRDQDDVTQHDRPKQNPGALANID
jgi:hypothetical protein